MYHTNRTVMGNISKTYAVFLTLIIIMSCLTVLMVKPANAKLDDSPSPPQFTIKYLDNSIQVQPTTTIDPYSGKTIVQEGHLIVNRTIELVVLNQPPQNYEAYYSLRVKGHYEKDWSNELYVISQSLDILFSSSNDGYYYTWMSRGGQGGFNIPSEGKIDFQMRAVLGYYTQVPDTQPAMPWSTGYLTVFNTTATSGWSDIKTLSLPEGSVSTTPFYSPNASTTPTSIVNTTASSNQELTNIALTVAVVVLAVASLLGYVRRIKRRLPNH